MVARSEHRAHGGPCAHGSLESHPPGNPGGTLDRPEADHQARGARAPDSQPIVRSAGAAQRVVPACFGQLHALSRVAAVGTGVARILLPAGSADRRIPYQRGNNAHPRDAPACARPARTGAPRLQRRLGHGRGQAPARQPRRGPLERVRGGRPARDQRWGRRDRVGPGGARVAEGSSGGSVHRVLPGGERGGFGLRRARIRAGAVRAAARRRRRGGAGCPGAGRELHRPQVPAPPAHQCQRGCRLRRRAPGLRRRQHPGSRDLQWHALHLRVRSHRGAEPGLRGPRGGERRGSTAPDTAGGGSRLVRE